MVGASATGLQNCERSRFCQRGQPIRHVLTGGGERPGHASCQDNSHVIEDTRGCRRLSELSEMVRSRRRRARPKRDGNRQVMRLGLAARFVALTMCSMLVVACSGRPTYPTSPAIALSGLRRSGRIRATESSSGDGRSRRPCTRVEARNELRRLAGGLPPRTTMASGGASRRVSLMRHTAIRGRPPADISQP